MKLSRKNAIPIWFWITCGVFGGISLLLFIVSTFYDLQISDYVTQITFKHWAAVTCTVFSAIGYWMPFPVIFICVAVILETYASHLKNNNEQLGKVNAGIARAMSGILIFYYVAFTIGMVGFFIYWSLTSKWDKGFGEWHDVQRSLEGAADVISGKILCLILTLAIFIPVAIHFRTVAKKFDAFGKTNYAKTAMVIIIYLIYSFVQVWIVKHLMGRPAYFSVRYTSENPYNGWSMFNYMTTSKANGGLGWSYDPDHKTWRFAQADYKPWYIWNNPLANLKYWFSTKPNTDPNNDQWFNMNFPSGHTNAAICMILLNLFFFSKDKAKTKLHRWQIAFTALSYFVVVLMMITMVMCRFHWTSDVAWTGAIYVLFLWLAVITIDRFGLYWTNLYNKNYKNYVAPKTHFVDDETGKTKTSFIYEDGSDNLLIFKFKWKDQEQRLKKIDKIKKTYYLDGRRTKNETS